MAARRCAKSRWGGPAQRPINRVSAPPNAATGLSNRQKVATTGTRKTVTAARAIAGSKPDGAAQQPTQHASERVPWRPDAATQGPPTFAATESSAQARSAIAATELCRYQPTVQARTATPTAVARRAVLSALIAATEPSSRPKYVTPVRAAPPTTASPVAREAARDLITTAVTAWWTRTMEKSATWAPAMESLDRAPPTARSRYVSIPPAPEKTIVSAGGGARTHRTLSRQRILSPPRLPFRHPGSVNRASLSRFLGEGLSAA